VRPVLATRNDHKLRELGRMGIDADPLPDGIDLPPETGDTFAANALIKARAAHAATGRPALADDSGIGAEPLGWAPGVRSARYAGEDASDRENLDRLRAEVRPGARLRYTCALALVTDTAEHVFTAHVEGTMSPEERGDRGFGYDPVVLPDAHPDRTMAELTHDEKDAISHRGLAARALAACVPVA
jgi:XTP/dITP diphosphohydrolase